jgi:hypothetical protein
MPFNDWAVEMDSNRIGLRKDMKAAGKGKQNKIVNPKKNIAAMLILLSVEYKMCPCLCHRYKIKTAIIDRL